MSDLPARAPIRTVTLRVMELTAVVRCGRCSHGIPYQGEETVPNCQECGWDAPMAWPGVLDEFGLVARLAKHGGHSTVMMEFTAELTLRIVTELRCPTCDQSVAASGEWFAAGGRCDGCHASFPSRPLRRDRLDLGDEGPNASERIVLFTLPAAGPKGVAAPVGVSCSACGAPLPVVASERTACCSRCESVNVLPVLTRARTALDTLYAARFTDVSEVPREWVFRELLDFHHVRLDFETALRLARSEEATIATFANLEVEQHRRAQRRADAETAKKERDVRMAILVPLGIAAVAVLGCGGLITWAAWRP